MAAGLCLTQDGRCRTVAGGPARSAPLALCPYLDVHKPPQPRVWVPRDGTLAAETSRFARLPALRLDAATCAWWKVATEPRGARQRQPSRRDCRYSIQSVSHICGHQKDKAA